MTPPDHLLNNHLNLWWQNSPAYRDHKPGSFGVPSTLTEITEAENHLRAQGCTLAIAPMEGNTWRTHRAVIETDGSPPFLLEPITPPETSQLLQESGYRILAQYTSSRIDLQSPTPDLSRLERRLRKVNLRPLNLSKLDEELRAIYQLSIHTFVENFLYTPIPEEEFLAQYLAFKSHLTADCAFLAEFQGKLVGFVFGYPDQDRFIVKTLAVLPERAFAGLGTLLVDRIQNQARQSGLTKAIHALQREDNQSLRISMRFNATVFRRYALFAKEL